MANSAEVLNYILGNPPQSTHHMNYNFLVPNLRGLQNFLKASEDAESSDKTPPGDIPTPPPSPKQAPEFPSSNTSTQDPNEMPSRPVWQQDEEPQPDPSTSTQNPNDMPPKPVWQQSSQSTPRASPAFDTEVSIFAAATEAFSKANTNCSIAESMERFKPIIELAKEKNIRVRGYVSVALGCPYEGPDVDPVKVADITRTLLEMGADEVSIADTTGMGTAPRTRELLKALTAAGIANQDLALHFHDTYGQALVNTVVGLEHGIRTFDSSVGGLGGCPYSKGATGNVATEDLVYTLHSLGVQTGIDVHKVAEIGSWISKELGRSNDTRAGKAILSRLSEKMP
jgi:hydroxymethylglutaryl-CoA lyase